MQIKFLENSLKRISDNWKLLSDDSDIFNYSNILLGELKSLCNEAILGKNYVNRNYY